VENFRWDSASRLMVGSRSRLGAFLKLLEGEVGQVPACLSHEPSRETAAGIGIPERVSMPPSEAWLSYRLVSAVRKTQLEIHLPIRSGLLYGSPGLGRCSELQPNHRREG
jgi:hypothetical protein